MEDIKFKNRKIIILWNPDADRFKSHLTTFKIYKKGFEHFGIEIDILNLQSEEFNNKIIEYFKDSNVVGFLSMGGWGIELNSIFEKNGKGLFELFNKKFINITGDYPFSPWIYDKLTSEFKNKFSFYTDKFSPNIVNKFSNIGGTHSYIPTVCQSFIKKDVEFIDPSDRKYQFLYVGGYHNPTKIRKDFFQGNNKFQYIFDSLLDASIFNYKESFIKIAERILKEKEVEVSIDNPDIRELLYNVNQFIRFERRRVLLQKLAKYPGYFILAVNTPNVNLHKNSIVKSDTSVPDVLDLMQNSKSVVMSLPNFAYGHSERFLNAMKLGCLAISNSNSLIEKEFVDKVDYLRLSERFENIDSHIDSLQKDEFVNKISRNGKRKVENQYSPQKIVEVILNEISKSSAYNKLKEKELETIKVDIKPKFSFIMIVLNGMPFVEYALKSIYEFAHEIVIVEGAVENCKFAANFDGSSKDGTVEAIKNFSDPDNKIKFIQGFWPEKMEMQNKALEYITGDYVWLIDSDEVYRNEDLEKVENLILKDPTITQINLIPDNFWKGFDYIFVSPRFFERENHYRRIFSYKKGAKFISHRPPTLIWPDENKTTEQMKLIDGNSARDMGIRMFHYSYIYPNQVEQKINLYKNYGWDKNWNIDFDEWYERFFLRWNEENRAELEKKFPVWTGDRNSATQKQSFDHPEVMSEFIKSFNKYKRKNMRDEKVNESDHLVMKHVIECIEKLKTQFDFIYALETGTIRSFDEKHESTKHISNTLGQKGKLISVDLSEKAINISKQICKNAENVNWILQDSIDYLNKLDKEIYEFVLLDSVNKSEHIFKEFQLVFSHVNKNGIIVIDDAGIKIDGSAKDVEVKAEKGHLVWEFLKYCNIDFEVKMTPKGHGTQLILELNYEKYKIIQKNLESFCNIQGIASIRKKRVKIAGSEETEKDLTQIDSSSRFAEEIARIIKEYKPKKLIETGTYLGTGTTSVIGKCLKQLGLDNTKFFSIEVKPENHFRAVANIKAQQLDVDLLNGLSVPRGLLPSLDKIKKDTITDIQFDDIFVDHQENKRAELYFNETNYENVEDDLLGRCLNEFDNSPDFVLLDSGGHMGNIEFNYLIERIKKKCILALDDINHIKHRKSFEQIKTDERFRILTSSDEKFGFCIAKFDPNFNELEIKDIKKILFVRTDSIGDNILASSMLENIKDKFNKASIDIVCQEHIAELYEDCTYIDNIISFDKKQAYDDEEYRNSLINDIVLEEYDLALNSVYSSEPLTDIFALSSKAREIIKIDGTDENSSDEWKNQIENLYTKIINFSDAKRLELLKHEEFLKGLSIDSAKLKPKVWLNKKDEKFAEDFFKQNNLTTNKTIVLFAGTQFLNRKYELYGKALNDICKKNGFSVIAVGSKEDFQINQNNLDLIESKTYNLSGKTSIKQTAAIIKNCRLAIGAETGNAHIACAVDTQNVILLGGGHFGRFMPYSNLTTCVCVPMDCYGCNWFCKYEKPYCITDIKPETIKQAVEETLNQECETPRIVFAEPTNESEQIVNKFIEDFGDSKLELRDEDKIIQSETLIANEEYEAAISLLKEILENDENNVEALNNLSVALYQLEQFEEAKKILSYILIIDSKNEMAKENLRIINNEISDK